MAIWITFKTFREPIRLICNEMRASGMRANDPSIAFVKGDKLAVRPDLHSFEDFNDSDSRKCSLLLKTRESPSCSSSPGSNMISIRRSRLSSRSMMFSLRTFTMKPPKRFSGNRRPRRTLCRRYQLDIGLFQMGSFQMNVKLGGLNYVVNSRHLQSRKRLIVGFETSKQGGSGVSFL